MILPMPMVSQLTQISADGTSPNAQMDCVPASIMAGILCLKGLKNWTPQYNPDVLLDKAYPEGYQGGTSASAFVLAVQQFGCLLTPYSNKNAKSLVAAAHEELQRGNLVIFTEADPYVPASWGWTHVCIFYGEPDASSLVALDPYPGKPVTKSDDEWSRVLLDGQVWILAKQLSNTFAHEYTIQPGDTLFAIATEHGTTVANLLANNEHELDLEAQKLGYRSSLGGNVIFPGTVLHW